MLSDDEIKATILFKLQKRQLGSEPQLSIICKKALKKQTSESMEKKSRNDRKRPYSSRMDYYQTHKLWAADSSQPQRK